MIFLVNGVEVERSGKKIVHVDGHLWRRETVGTVNQRLVNSGKDSLSFKFTLFYHKKDIQCHHWL